MSKFKELSHEAQKLPNSIELMKEWDDILDYYLDIFKEKDKETYTNLMDELFVSIHGEHLTEEMAHNAVSKMMNEDGTSGEHYTMDLSKLLAERNGITWNDFNMYDWYYVLNMVYSDYYKVFGNDDNMYIKLALAWLNDKDISDGKAYRYFKNVVE
ncbi:MAG: hypothetical protein MJ244_04425 [Clostridia bacterium]|nr:hypothetical protein [Clostridia bacterium]